MVSEDVPAFDLNYLKPLRRGITIPTSQELDPRRAAIQLQELEDEVRGALSEELRSHHSRDRERLRK